jgi:hypothetical protein
VCVCVCVVCSKLFSCAFLSGQGGGELGTVVGSSEEIL